MSWIPYPEIEADRLDLAAAEIDARGWRQGAGGGRTVCARDAYVIAIQGDGERTGYGLTALSLHLGLRATESIPDWNDANGRTQAEVTAAMRDTARDLRAIARARRRDWAKR